MWYLKEIVSGVGKWVERGPIANDVAKSSLSSLNFFTDLIAACPSEGICIHFFIDWARGEPDPFLNDVNGFAQQLVVKGKFVT